MQASGQNRRQKGKIVYMSEEVRELLTQLIDELKITSQKYINLNDKEFLKVFGEWSESILKYLILLIDLTGKIITFKK